MQAIGLKALLMISTSHFILYMLEKDNLITILELCTPERIEFERKHDDRDIRTLAARQKVLECLSEMCRTQAHGFFRVGFLNSPKAYGLMIEHMFRALKMNALATL